jgi:hypothetical protein
MVVSMADFPASLDFKASLTSAAPAPRLGAPLAGLWWAAKGDWDQAHRLVQDDPSAEAAWVHAYLHRVEGDLGNAGYWYRRAGRPAADDAVEAEWERIASTLLGEKTA